MVEWLAYWTWISMHQVNGQKDSILLSSRSLNASCACWLALRCVIYLHWDRSPTLICLILQKWRILHTVLVRKTSKQINLYQSDVTFYLFTVYQPPGIISICFQIKEHFSLNSPFLHLWWYSQPIFVFIYMWFVRPHYSYTHMFLYAHECLILMDFEKQNPAVDLSLGQQTTVHKCKHGSLVP